MGQYETPKAGVDVPDLTADGDVRAALDKQKKKQEEMCIRDREKRHENLSCYRRSGVYRFQLHSLYVPQV